MLYEVITSSWDGSSVRCDPTSGRHLSYPCGRLENPEDIGLLFSHLPENTFVELVKIVDFDKLVTVFNNMPSDDAAELLGCLDEELSYNFV